MIAKMVLWIAVLVLPNTAFAGTCYGLKDCSVCTTCGYCKHCNVPGQKQFCGVYYHSNANPLPELKVRAKRLPKQQVNY